MVAIIFTFDKKNVEKKDKKLQQKFYHVKKWEITVIKTYCVTKILGKSLFIQKSNIR